MVAGDVIDFPGHRRIKKQLLISQTTSLTGLNLKVGEKVLVYFVQEPLRVRPFIIKGIFSFELDEVDKTFVVGDMSIISRINNWGPGQIADTR